MADRTVDSSMLQWGHGDEAVEEARRSAWRLRRSPGFNGATAMKPWKRASVDGCHGTWRPLQWGHGDEAVEEEIAWPVARREHELQWGHGDEAVEETGIGLGLADISTLQWGHGDEAVEELPTRRSHRLVAVLQWGHGDEAVEETVMAVRQAARVCFNGATAMKPWKRARPPDHLEQRT